MHRFISVSMLHRVLRFIIRSLNWTISHHDQVCKANIIAIEKLQRINILLDKEAVWATTAIARVEQILEP